MQHSWHKGNGSSRERFLTREQPIVIHSLKHGAFILPEVLLTRCRECWIYENAVWDLKGPAVIGISATIFSRQEGGHIWTLRRKDWADSLLKHKRIHCGELSQKWQGGQYIKVQCNPGGGCGARNAEPCGSLAEKRRYLSWQQTPSHGRNNDRRFFWDWNFSSYSTSHTVLILLSVIIICWESWRTFRGVENFKKRRRPKEAFQVQRPT